MGKKKNNKEFPTVEKLSKMGFQDGYAGIKSKEDALIVNFCKRKITQDQITPRILAYSLGYEKGKLVLEHGLVNCTIIKGEVAINNKVVKLDEVKEYEINEKIKSLVRSNKKKGRK